MCHLVGENGLGKTTLLNQISGLLPVTHGTITKSPLVYIAHQLGISPALTVAQNLRFLLSLYDIQADDDMLDTALEDYMAWATLLAFGSQQDKKDALGWHGYLS